jgi:hypothetical protein
LANTSEKENKKNMKIFDRAVSTSARCLAVAAIVLLAGFGTRSLAAPASKSLSFVNSEKHVQIKVEIHGDIDHHTVDSVEHLVSEWLEAAHFVVSHTDGANYLHLHVRVDVSDNHHYKVHSDCADWHEDKEAAVVDAIDDILHHMISDFIDKYSH